ncbi:MAG: DivIVA domain-containing protein [Oscillospiraceae bacterium]|nr:DivIVA domain-containing protein [Oscillospiraceae bacterium]MDD3832662.1 DivIVA domain-containing protein [Oscillospiraceae bacterium]MDD4546677.1 DivIVA domain-containing protein [Oscillospiraceae bacterium]
MLTANEIRNIQFTKSVGGCKVTEVEEFIEQCAETVSELTASKAELEKKLEILADKLVEYRSDEDNIRTALLSAQKLGDTVVREAKHKAGLVLDDAKIRAEKILENAQSSISNEEGELDRIRQEVTNFKARMLSIYKEHLALIDVLPGLDDKKEKQAKPVAVPQPVQESRQEAAPSVVLDIPELKDEDENNADSQVTDDGMRPVSRFGDLKFGDNYDISKDNEQDTSGFFHRNK